MKWTDESDRAPEPVDLDAWRAEAGACAPLDAAATPAWALGTLDAGDGRQIVTGGPIPIAHIRVSCVPVGGRIGSREITPEQRDNDARYAVAARTGWPRDAARVGVLADRCEALQAALSEALDEFEDAIQYKLDYLVTKHGDRETLARLRALAAGGAPKGESR